MMVNKILFSLVICLIFTVRTSFGADISVIGSMQGYISTDFNSESFHDKNRPFEVFNSKKGQTGLNSAFLGSQISGKDYYGTFTMQFGDYAHSFRNDSQVNIQEAFVGYHISKKIDVEAGYFLSEKGQQLFRNNKHQISCNPWYVYNFPLNLAGINFKYKPSKQFEFSLSALNSIYDRQSRTGNLAYSPSIKYKNDFARVSITGYYGNEMFGKYKIFQMYNLFSTEFDLTDQITVGTEYMYNSYEALPLRRAKPRSMRNLSFYAYYQVFEKFSVAARFSRLWNDDSMWNMPNIISNDAALSMEYKPSNKSFVRFEVRDLLLEGENRKAFMMNDGMPVNYRTDIALVFGFSFDRLLFEDKTKIEK